MKVNSWMISAAIGVVFALFALFTSYRPDVLAIFSVGFLLHPLLEFSIISHVSRVIERDVGRIANIADAYESNWEAVRDDVEEIKKWRDLIVNPALQRMTKKEG